MQTQELDIHVWSAARLKICHTNQTQVSDSAARTMNLVWFVSHLVASQTPVVCSCLSELYKVPARHYT